MPSAIDWKLVTWPSTRQGVTSTLLTILPGQEAGGVSAVWPRTVTVSGAELAAPGLSTAKSAARQPAMARARAARRRLWVGETGIEYLATPGRRASCGANLAEPGAWMRPRGTRCTILATQCVRS